MTRWLRLVVVVQALVLVGVTLAYAARPQAVWATKHNLSTSSPYTTYASGSETAICIFCHTPHGGDLNAPLWNRPWQQIASEGGTKDLRTSGVSAQFGGWTHYNSVTLSAAFDGQVYRAVNYESLACMSCHDGSIAVNRVLNPSNVNGIMDNGVGLFIEDYTYSGNLYLPQIGASRQFPTNTDWGHLEDDHPISFSYYDAESDETANSINGLNPANLLWSDSQLPGYEGPRFYGGSGAGNMRVECPTCHDPHVAYDTSIAGSPAQAQYAPFLVMTNAGSAMCLKCHNK